MTGFALETRNLVKRYGRRRVLDGFTLAVPRGAVLGLVGANGAGKTTWMMTVAGLLRPASGTIDMLGCGPLSCRWRRRRWGSSTVSGGCRDFRPRRPDAARATYSRP